MPPLMHNQVVCLFLPLFPLMSVPPWQFCRISPQHWDFLAALLQPGCVTPSACNWHFSGYPGSGRRCRVQRRNSSLVVTQSWSILPLISVMPLRLYLAADQLRLGLGRCAAYKGDELFGGSVSMDLIWNKLRMLSSNSCRVPVCVSEGGTFVFYVCVARHTEPVCSLWWILPLCTAAQPSWGITPRGLLVPL